MESHQAAHGPTTWLLDLPFLSHDPHYEHVNGAILVTLFLTVVSVFAYLRIRKNIEAHVIPSPKLGLVSFVDFFIESIFNMVSDVLGKNAKKYFPFIATIFIFILFSNLLGILPMGSAPTSNLNTTLAIGLASFVYYNVMGIREQGLIGYLKHFLMGLGPAGVLIAALEMVSHCIRPLTLGLRLFINMFVDHTLLLVSSDFAAYILPCFVIPLGLFVSVVQAFVFAILTAVYVQMAVEHDH